MISAFVPTLNNERTIGRVLKCLKAQTIKPDKIIVIDSGSTDKTEEIVLSEGCEFYSPSFWGLDFLGLSKARNRVLELIDTPYLLSVDSDILIEPDHVERAIKCFDIDDKIAGVAGKQIELFRIELGDHARATVEMRDLIRPIEEQENEYPQFLLGSNNIYKTDVLKQIGLKVSGNQFRPFNDDLKTNYEDVDIGTKIGFAGLKVYKDNSIKTYHLQKDTLFSYVNRAYRYRLFKWKMNNAFKDIESYQGKFEHNINYTKMGFDICFKRGRSYLSYAYLFTGVNFFLEDTAHFIEAGRKDIADNIVNSFYTALDFLESDYLKEHIVEDNAHILDGYTKDSNEISSKFYEWFKSLFSLELLDKKFPAVHDDKVDTIDDAIKIKVLESSKKRELKNDHMCIYGYNRVMLVNLPWRKGGRYGVRAGSRWPHSYSLKDDSPIPRYIPYPFFLSYSFSKLQESAVSSWLLDAVAEGMNDDEVLYTIKGYEPQLLIIETSTPSFCNDIVWAEKIKNEVGCKICFVGPHVDVEKESLLKNYQFIDYGIFGEYEDSVVDLAQNIFSDNDLKNIKGIIFRDSESIYISEDNGLSDFENFPPLIHETLPFYNYNDRPMPSMAYPCMQIQLTRGCPYSCSFCLWPQVIYSGKYRKRSLEKTIVELADAKNIYGVKSFYVDDDTFNVDRKFIREFAEKLIDNEINLPWTAMARADCVADRETLLLLKKSGLSGLKFGVESVDSNVLKEINKKLDIKSVEDTLTLCRELNIETHLTFSLGYISDTIETVRKTFEWSIEQDSDYIQVSIVTPFPNTAMYNNAIEKGILLNKDFSNYDGYTGSMLKLDLDEKYLIKARELWVKLFYSLKNNVCINEHELMYICFGSENAAVDKNFDNLKNKFRIV